ncbi:MAG: extracellular solute-binding protein [Phycisphaerales bacterium]
MLKPRWLILVVFAFIIGAPLVVRLALSRSSEASPTGTDPSRPAARLIIVTPHVQQIRDEFGRAFASWHLRVHGEPVVVDWRQPGGTTEIIKLLQAQYGALLTRAMDGLRRSNPAALDDPAYRADEFFPEGSGAFDLMLGGGSFDHGRLKDPRGVAYALPPGPDGKPRAVQLSVSVPAGFSSAELTEWYGENAIGAEKLYDPAQHWLGTALSGFGIVYNRALLARIGHEEPRRFADLGHPAYAGLLAMADARQSGSVATLYDSILNRQGWEPGWRVLREMAANARYFSSSSTMPPIDVGQGEALAGVAIDFYGRGQAQCLLQPGETPETGRVGYIDPAGEVYIDADPVSLLRGAPNPELARRFIRFTLSDEGQALWQFAPRTDPASAANPVVEDPRGGPVRLGPAEHRLRRMPVRRSIYERYTALMADRTNPFEIASDTRQRGWRDGMIVMMGCFGVDAADELKPAWRALCAARAGRDIDPTLLAEMERLFFAFPRHTCADGRVLPFNEANYQDISADVVRWRDGLRGPRAKVAYTSFFRSNFAEVVRIYQARDAQRD